MKNKIIYAAVIVTLAFTASAMIRNEINTQTVYVGVKQFITEDHWQYLLVSNIPKGICDSPSGPACTLYINIKDGGTSPTIPYSDVSHTATLKGNSTFSDSYYVDAPFTPEAVE